MRRSRAPRDEPGPRSSESGSFGTDLGPAGPTWPRRTNQDTDGSSPRDEPGPRRTNQSLWDTIRALLDGPEPR